MGDQGGQTKKITTDLPQLQRQGLWGSGGGMCAAALLPDLKMVSQANVWSCQTLVLRLL